MVPRDDCLERWRIACEEYCRVCILETLELARQPPHPRRRMLRKLSSLALTLSVLFCTGMAEETRESVVWEFNDSNQLPGRAVGLARVVSGTLHEPAYPSFPQGNRVLELAAPSWIQIPDAADNDLFDLKQGDEVTFEAWVQLRSIGKNMCLVGKGRTGTSGYKAINQNWAFRLRNVSGTARLNLLFRSQDANGHKGDWHRWTSDEGFVAGRRWHHVAVSYRFGDPESIQGVLDGNVVAGRWDMGGPTTAPPIVDEDDVWIGSTMAGSKGNSFDGAMDRLAIHPRILPPEELQQRYRWNPPEAKPPTIPNNQVVFQLFESDAGVDAIPIDVSLPMLEWTQEEIALAALPHVFDEWGVREDWPATVLVRAWANVQFPPGRQQLQLRSRGRSRLLIDGKVVAETARQKPAGNAHQLVHDLPPVPHDDMRPAAMGDHETTVDIDSDGSVKTVLWEIVVGGPRYRVEVGETSLAVASPEGMFHLVSPQTQIPLTDAGWAYFTDKQGRLITDLDRLTRQRDVPDVDRYWRRRHEHAQNLIRSVGEIPAIDDVIDARVHQLRRSDSSEEKFAAVDIEFFNTRVRPIFEQRCGRCHLTKQQGGLHLASRHSMVTGGESGVPAVVPGDPGNSPLLDLITADLDEYRMPPLGDGLTAEEVGIVREWIRNGAPMPEVNSGAVTVPDRVDEMTYLRRVFLDTVGVPPTRLDVDSFLADPSVDRRQRLVRKLLRDERWADNWTGYWQDVYAENPNLLKPTLNNTGPFRFWIHDALEDNKSLDRFATELIMMRGGKWSGGAAGFELASQNDVPMAAKSMVLSSAFLGANMKCARCHDAPYHDWTQGQLFEMAAMLDRSKLRLPATSTVPAAFFEAQERQSLIEVTLKPGVDIHGRFPFPEFSTSDVSGLLLNQDDSRELLALKITTSRRFAEVIANRIWKRFFGLGIVDPVDDWEGNPASNPALLQTLADLLIVHHYDGKALSEAILTSRAYQRRARSLSAGEARHFAGPYRRRMTAEQIVDSAFHVVGLPMATEQLTLDVEGAHPADRFLNFGYPRHAWEFTTLANERDRPSLALPRVQAVTDVLKAFGWRNSRPEPLSERDDTPNLIQPGVLANGTVGVWLTRLSDQHGLTRVMLSAATVEELVDDLYVRLLTRHPTEAEETRMCMLLSDGFDDRVVDESASGGSGRPARFRYVSWSNHLNTEANVIKLQMQERARQGDPPTKRLRAEWRERAEDAIWSLLNSPEMILVP